jgi:hypothetical protein
LDSALTLNADADLLENPETDVEQAYHDAFPNFEFRKVYFQTDLAQYNYPAKPGTYVSGQQTPVGLTEVRDVVVKLWNQEVRGPAPYTNWTATESWSPPKYVRLRITYEVTLSADYQPSDILAAAIACRETMTMPDWRRWKSKGWPCDSEHEQQALGTLVTAQGFLTPPHGAFSWLAESITVP